MYKANLHVPISRNRLHILIVTIHVIASFTRAYHILVCLFAFPLEMLPNSPVYPCNYCNYFVVTIAPIFTITICNSYYSKYLLLF